MRRLAFLIAAPLIASCDGSYEPPCRVAWHDVLVADPGIGPRTSVDLHRSEGRIVASWPKRELADAGASDPFPALTAFEVALLDERASLLRRETVATPPELAARRGSVDAAGVVVEEGAVLVYWVETTTTTDPDGRVRIAYATKIAYRGGAVVAPAGAACSRCRLRIAFASLGSASIAIVRTEPDLPEATLGGPPAAPTFGAFVLRRDGTVTAEEVPWLAIAPASSPADGGLAAAATIEPELSLEVDAAGRLVLVTDQRAWLLDRALRPLAGPIALPSSDARIAWGSTAQPSIAWSVAPSQEGRASGSSARREIFAGSADARERVSRGRAVLAADRRGDEIGVTFESAGRTFFAALDPHAHKRGGDVLVRPAEDPARESEYGVYVPRDASMLVANGSGRFTSVTLGNGSLSAAEVVCAP